MADLITLEMGSPTSFSNLAQSPAPWMQIEAFLAIAREFPWEEERAGVARLARRRTPRAGRRGRGDPAVERPAVHDHVQAGAGAAVGLHDGREAGAGDAARRLPARRAAHRGRRTRTAWSTSSPPAARSASTWSRTRASTRSRSPARPRPGRKIAAVCGEQLKRVSLELGGKSAAIVLDDADLTATMEGLRFTALMNSGQACVAQTRILASRANYDAVVDALVETVASMPVGDPADPATEIGPLVAQRQQERVEKYIALGQEEGARVALGGNGMPDGLVVGLVRPPDRLRRRRQRDADRPGGDLRPGPLGDPVRRRGRRGPDRQRLRLRPGRHGLDRGSRGRPRRGPPGPRRHLRREHLHDGLRGAVRRLQVLGDRPRVRARGAGAVHRAEVDLHGGCRLGDGIPGYPGIPDPLGRCNPQRRPEAAQRPGRRCGEPDLSR